MRIVLCDIAMLLLAVVREPASIGAPLDRGKKAHDLMPA
jgi:hypothetical protein